MKFTWPQYEMMNREDEVVEVVERGDLESVGWYPEWATRPERKPSACRA